jgi:hypothetical protein
MVDFLYSNFLYCARKVFGGFLIAHLCFNLIPRTFANNFYLSIVLLLAGTIFFARFERRDVTLGLLGLSLFVDRSSVLFSLLYGASLIMACDDAIPDKDEKAPVGAAAAVLGFIFGVAFSFIFDMPI